MITADQTRLAAELRHDGASAFEAVAVVQTVLELAAWERELRDAHGRFTKSASSVTRDVVSHDAEHEQIHLRATAVAQAEARAEAARAVNVMALQHKSDMAKLMSDIRSANQRFTEEKEKGEDKRRITTLAVHVGLLVAGALLALIEHFAGAPDLVQLASALAPQVLQELVDWRKKLS